MVGDFWSMLEMDSAPKSRRKQPSTIEEARRSVRPASSVVGVTFGFRGAWAGARDEVALVRLRVTVSRQSGRDAVDHAGRAVLSPADSSSDGAPATLIGPA